MKKPAGSRRVLEKPGWKKALPSYPFIGRAASMAGDQRHHQVCAERTWIITGQTCAGLPGGSTGLSPDWHSPAESSALVHARRNHEQRITPHDLASWPLFFRLVYGPVCLRVAGDNADALSL